MKRMAQAAAELLNKNLIPFWAGLRDDVHGGFYGYHVDGAIPEFEELLPMSRNTVRLLGIHRDKIPPAGRDEA